MAKRKNNAFPTAEQFECRHSFRFDRSEDFKNTFKIDVYVCQKCGYEKEVVREDPFRYMTAKQEG